MSVYISLLTLNARSRQVQSETRDCYQLHRTLAKAFATADGDPIPIRYLFRLDSIDSQSFKVLVQAKTEPQWSRLTVSPGYFAAAPDVKRVDPKFTVGQVFAFRLRANPTIIREGKRTGLYKEEEMEEWIKRKSILAGFQLRRLVLHPEGQITGSKASTKIAFSSALYDGTLAVTNVELFTAAWEGGIGAAKGFGFGLLSLARPKE